MIQVVNPKGYWTKGSCKEEMLKYKTRTQFAKGCNYGYKLSQENGWLDELFPKNKE